MEKTVKLFTAKIIGEDGREWEIQNFSYEIIPEMQRILALSEDVSEAGGNLMGEGNIDSQLLQVGSTETIQEGRIELYDANKVTQRVLTLLGITLRSDFPGDVSVIARVIRRHND